jgi:hypothetical protein
MGEQFALVNAFHAPPGIEERVVGGREGRPHHLCGGAHGAGGRARVHDHPQPAVAGRGSTRQPLP